MTVHGKHRATVQFSMDTNIIRETKSVVVNPFGQHCKLEVSSDHDDKALTF